MSPAYTQCHARSVSAPFLPRSVGRSLLDKLDVAATVPDLRRRFAIMPEPKDAIPGREITRNLNHVPDLKMRSMRDRVGTRVHEGGRASMGETE